MPERRKLKPLPEGAADLINEARALVAAGCSYSEAAELTGEVFATATIEALVEDAVGVCHTHGFLALGLVAPGQKPPDGRGYELPSPVQIEERAEVERGIRLTKKLAEPPPRGTDANFS